MTTFTTADLPDLSALWTASEQLADVRSPLQPVA